MNEEPRLEEEETPQQLEYSLKEMEAALTNHYCNLGKQLLEVAEQENREVGHLVDKIIEARKKLSVLQQTTVQCPSCSALNARGSNYCNVCGKRLSKGEQP